MTYTVNGILGPEVRCEPGEVVYPLDCERHPVHHWCGTCQGYYGVPHTGIHEGPNAHPNIMGSRECVCRICKNYRGE